MIITGKLYFLFCALLIAHCFLIISCTTSYFAVSDNDFITAQRKFPGISVDDLNTGKQLYINKCGSCHRLYKPDQFSTEKWLEKMPDMEIEAKLTNKESELIKQYLITKCESSQ